MSPSYAESDPRTTTPVANLSRTGALVVSTPLHPIGSRIELRFVAFPEDPVLFVHTGRVVRHLESPLAMGVEFDSMPDEVVVQLDTLLERAKANSRDRRRRHRRRLWVDGGLDAHDLRIRILNK